MPVVIPSFAPAPGENAESFMARLANLGLEPQPTTDESEFDPGNVYDTQPPVGDRVRQGAPVKVRVRSSPRNSCADHGTNEDPDPSRGWKPMTRAQFDPAPLPPAPFVDGQGNEVPLRWGHTLKTDALDRYGRPIGWRGWGYRKIQAKHGWNASDVSLTTEALTHQAQDAKWTLPSVGKLYVGTPRFVGSDICARVVVVDFTLYTMPGGGEQLVKGISNSYDVFVAHGDEGGEDE
jgi:hypothetical protein